MAQYKKTVVNRIKKSEDIVTDDNLYWKRYNFPVTVKEYGAVTDVNFCEEKPNYFAVTSSTKVQVYDPSTNQVHRNLSRFQKVAYGGKLRRDGKLLIAGGDECQLKLFDVEAKSILRIFKGHSGSIHKCDFLPNNKQVVSFCDDKAVSIWDIASEKQLHTFNEHQDYVRAGTVNSLNPNMIISGSYDHTVKLLDARTNKSVLTLNHGDPVESVLLFPNGFVLASAGGKSLKLWDLMGSGKLLANLNNHHKTVTCLCLATDNSRLLSGSLDRHVKIYDTSSFNVVHTMDYSSPVLSIAVSPDDKTVVTGMSDGLFSIQHQAKKKEKKVVSKNVNPYEKFINPEREVKLSHGDVRIKSEKPKNLSRYDKYLKSFQSSKALDVVLREYYQLNQPQITVGVIQELARRGTLKNALAGRESSSLSLIIKFTIKYINDIRFSRSLLDVANLLLDIYGNEVGQCEKTDNLFKKLRDVSNRELNYMQDVMKLQGVLDIVMGGKDYKI